MNIKSIAEAVVLQPRQRGQTTALVEAVRKIDRAVLVCHDLRTANRISEQEGIQVTTLHDLARSGGRGDMLVYVFDNAAIQHLMLNVRANCERLEMVEEPIQKALNILKGNF